MRAARAWLGSFGRRHVSMIALLALGLGACSTKDILEVKDPDVPGPGALNGVEGLSVLLAGAVGDFHEGYIGSGPGVGEVAQIGVSGLLSDEIRSAETYIDRSEIDQRATTDVNRSNISAFFTMQVARASADRVAGTYERLAPDSSGRALMLALSGFSTVILGENYCSGIPFSSIDEAGTVITYGDPTPTQDVWVKALAKFDTAGTVGNITDVYKNLIAIGRGRALLDNGDYAGAAAAVADVPAGFVYNIESSANATREMNGLWSFINANHRISIANKEGGNGEPGSNGLDFIDANDPRVPYVDNGVLGIDNRTPVVFQLKYPTSNTPVPLATAAEARLIEAEAALHVPNDDLFLTKLNAARAEFPGVSPLTTADIPATLDGKVDLLFRERAFSLWLTSHRLGDMRRLIRQYGRDAETVFPSGNWIKGPVSAPTSSAPYGTAVNLPIPQTELNNPNSHGCLDRNP
jgi:hypothetical protein